MQLDEFQLISWFLLSTMYFAKALCPSTCRCKLDEYGRRRVACKEGGMQNPIPTENMDEGTQIVNITAPDTNWNNFNLGHVFQRLKYLEEIHITRSNILYIGMHTFWGVPTLKVLNLSFNNISDIQEHNFRGLFNLLELNLNNNKIERLEGGVFIYLLELRILNLENNRIKEIVPRVFIKLVNLQVLRLSGNPIGELEPQIFKDILELGIFECRRCGLIKINTHVYHLLPYLSHLDISFNRIQYLDTDEFQDLHRLRYLKLDGNLLPIVIEKVFSNQVELKTLSLSRNRIVKITDNAFFNLSNLVELDLSYNKLKQLETVALEAIAETLTKLDLSGNRFSTSVISKVIHALPKLRDVAVGNMEISSLQPGIFPDNIRILDLSGNNLTKLNFTVLPRQLVELDLSNNHFRGLDEFVAVKLARLHKLNLDENPWICDVCNMFAIIRHFNQTEHLQSIKCNEPSHLKGRLLVSLDVHQLPSCLKNQKTFTTVFLSVPFLTIVIIVIAFLVIVFFTFAIISYRKRRIRRVVLRSKRIIEDGSVLETPAAIFTKGNISFKFPLDLTEGEMSVSTIDDIKKHTKLYNLPNGRGTGI